MSGIPLNARIPAIEKTITMEKITARQFWTYFLLTCALMTAYALYQGRGFLFGPGVLETGDFAANGMQIFDARTFRDIWGNYSRWGFSHPGPFFFYIYSFGERLLLDWTGLVQSPHQAHVIAGTIFQSACISLAMCLLMLMTGRRLTLVLCLACAAWLFPRTMGALTSIWPPHVLLGPYVLLLVSCAGVSVGRVNMLPVAVFATCVLCHGHVAQPLMTMPLLLLAVALFLHGAISCGTSLRAIFREAKPQIWMSLAIIGLFLIPLLVDLTLCPNCNANRIVAYFKTEHGARPRTGQALNYVASYLRLDHNFEWLDSRRSIPRSTRRVLLGLASLVVLIVLPWLFRRRMEGPQYRVLRNLAWFALFSVVLAIIWAKRITGPLFEFNAFFIYGIVLIGACTIITTLSMMVKRKASSLILAGAGAAGTVALVALGPTLPMVTAPLMLALPQAATAQEQLPTLPVVLNQDRDDDWPATTALALWLTRNHVDFMVPPGWAYVFGWKHALDLDRGLALSNRFEIWEPGNDLAMLDKHAFDMAQFCHITKATHPLELGSTPISIDDARRNCALAAFGLGKPPQDAWGWTTSPFVAFQFVGKKTEHPVRLIFDVMPFTVPGKLQEQIVRVLVNGSPVGEATIKEGRMLSFSVPSSVWNASQIVTVVLALPNAASPASLGLSIDSRVIALGFKGMGIQYEDVVDHP
jgi:succinate dehydrogenase hydrophobic anchor subunit